MNTVRRCGLVIPAVLLAGLLASGCGGQRIEVHGRLLEDGEPYEMQPSEEFCMSFIKQEESESSTELFEADIGKDGTFIVSNPKGKGLPPGKYRIEITCTPYGAAGNEDEEDEEVLDKFDGKYSSDQSPLEVEVTPEMGEIIIDLARGTVSKQA